MKTNGDNKKPKKNWKHNIKISDKEMRYWLDYLAKNEKRFRSI